MAEKKEKRYVSDNAQLMAEWDWEKNNEECFDPTVLLEGSNKRVFWKCDQGHCWQSRIIHRANGSGCPYCTNQKLQVGFNDLESKHPSLSKEWSFEYNKPLTPRDVLCGSGNKFWWQCDKGHKWQATISDRLRGRGCPYCSNKKVLVGFNDLKTTSPILATEWNYERNAPLIPEDFVSGSSKKVWWICKKGHEWEAPISRRHSGDGCPICNRERHTSFNENAILYYCKKYYPQSIGSFKPPFLLGKEIDIYIPELNVGIEYDGQYHHQNLNRDVEKNNLCHGHLKLIRIREPNCPTLIDNKSINYCLSSLRTAEIEKAISWILKTIGNASESVISLNDDVTEIYNLIELKDKRNSFYEKMPHLIAEWDFKKNGNITPKNVDVNSGKVVWWKCNKGHSWQARVYTRSEGIGCPYCSGRFATESNNLLISNPQLCKEWDYTQNTKSPKDYTPLSAQKVWWRCSNGHSYYSRISGRVQGSGCPYCSGRSVLEGFNDLSTNFPELEREWNYEKNTPLTPNTVSKGSNKSVWWICEKCGYEWKATINNRTKGNGCPECARAKRKKNK